MIRGGELLGVNFGSVSEIDMIILKIFLKLKKSIKFVLTVLAALKLKKAAYQGESFAFIWFPRKSKTYILPVRFSIITFLIYVL